MTVVQVLQASGQTWEWVSSCGLLAIGTSQRKLDLFGDGLSLQATLALSSLLSFCLSLLSWVIGMSNIPDRSLTLKLGF